MSLRLPATASSTAAVERRVLAEALDLEVRLERGADRLLGQESLQPPHADRMKGKDLQGRAPRGARSCRKGIGSH